MYNIIDRHTGAIVATVQSRRAAIRSVDRRDNAYGACRYTYLRADLAELAEWRAYYDAGVCLSCEGDIDAGVCAAGCDDPARIGRPAGDGQPFGA